MMLRLLPFCLCLIVGCSRASFGQGIACQYEVAAVIAGPPCGLGAPITVATALNNVGTVVGYYRCTAGAPRPFKWTEAGGFQFIPLPPWLGEASPADVNDHNIMVGTGNKPGVGQRGFVCDLNTEVWTELPSQNVSTGWSGATGINSSNVVSGWRSIDDGGDPVNPLNSFRWSVKTGFVDLGLIDGMTNGAAGIADDGMISLTAAYGLYSFIWDGARSLTSIGTLQGADSVSAHAIADENHVVGASLFISGPLTWAVPFEFHNGFLEALPTLPAPNTSCTALAVTNAGLIIGGCKPIGQGDWRPTAWFGGEILDLEALIVPQAGVLFDYAIGASEGGVILCSGRVAGSSVSLVLTPLAGPRGDINCDATVNIDDLLRVIGSWGPGPSLADINGDQIVNVFDLLIVIEEWSA